jgi:hypothetical protein
MMSLLVGNHAGHEPGSETMTSNELNAAIAAATKELVIREQAMPNLQAGFPRRHNAIAIDQLYDRLNALHIARLEAK